MQFNIANQSNLDGARVAFHAAFLEFLGLVDALPLEEALLEVPSSTSVEEWEWLSDLPGFEEWSGDRVLDSFKAFKMRVANKDWSSGIGLHQNQFKDDKLGLFSTSIQMMAEAARQHRAEFAAQLLINGFDGTKFPKVSNGLGYDGKFFFDTTRATGSNKMTTALTPDAAGLAALIAAEVLLGSQTNYAGTRKLRIGGTHLIVGPKLRPVADKLMTSDFLANTAGTGGTVGAQATESNFLKGRYKIIVEPWLADDFDDYWFLADLSKTIKPCLFQMREEISTSAIVGNQGGNGDSIPRFQKGQLWFGAEARYNVAYFESRLIVGSQVA